MRFAVLVFAPKFDIEARAFERHVGDEDGNEILAVKIAELLHERSGFAAAHAHSAPGDEVELTAKAIEQTSLFGEIAFGHVALQIDRAAIFDADARRIS